MGQPPHHHHSLSLGLSSVKWLTCLASVYSCKIRDKQTNPVCHLSRLLHIFLNPCTVTSTIISRVYAAFRVAVPQMFMEWLIWLFDAPPLFLWIFTPLFSCKNRHVLLWISRKRSDPPPRSEGCFYFTILLSFGLLLSHSCITGLIKQQ